MTNWQNRMFREYIAGRPYLRDTRENQLSPSVMILCISVMCRTYVSLCGKASRKLPTKTSCSSLCLESSHSFSHTTLTKKSHIKYKVHRDWTKLQSNLERNKSQHKLVVNHNFTRQLNETVLGFLFGILFCVSKLPMHPTFK